MSDYTWGSSPEIPFTITDNVYRDSSDSTYYSGYITVTIGACNGNKTFGYNISATVDGTTVQLKGNTPNQWSSGTYSHSFYVSGSTTSSSISLYVTLSSNAPRGSTDFEYSTSIGSYSPPATEPSSVPTLSAASTKLGSPVIIYTNRQNRSYKHTLTYACGGTTGTIASNVTTNCTWTPPTSLIDKVTSAGTPCTITCTTYYGSTNKGSNVVSLTLYPPDDALPAVEEGWFQVERVNVTEASGITEWIKGYSRAKITFDASKVTPKYESTVSSFSVTYGGNTTQAANNEATTGILTGTSARITVKVTDSRGFSTAQDYTVTLLDYAPPTITAMDVFRSDSQKAKDDDGNYLCAKCTAGCTSLNGKNSVTLTGSYKQNGASSYGAETAMESGVYTLVNSTEVSNAVSYIVRLKATDALGNVTVYEQLVSTKAITFHLKSGGLGAAFGKMAESDDLLEIQWDLQANGDVVVLGDLYANNLADNVVEQGKSGNWSYRKWASGRSEAWYDSGSLGTLELEYMTDGVYSSNDINNISVGLPTGVFNKAPDCFQINAISNAYTISQVCGATASSVNYRLWRSYSGSMEIRNVHIYCMGTWK